MVTHMIFYLLLQMTMNQWQWKDSRDSSRDFWRSLCSLLPAPPVSGSGFLTELEIKHDDDRELQLV